MKKIIFAAVAFVAFSATAFANDSINVKVVKSSKKGKVTLVQFYDIECRNGNKVHKAFDSLQAAWDYGLKFCAAN